MTISIIVAMDKKGTIGKDGDLPWHFPEDLEYFREKTWRKCVIMGRKTYESIESELENREVIVLSRNETYRPEGATKAESISEALNKTTGDEVFVAGGANIYEQFLKRADKMYVTEINDEFEGDIYFPDFERDEWNLIHEEKGDNPLLTFKIFKR